jgi:hypothetical protein
MTPARPTPSDAATVLLAEFINLKQAAEIEANQAVAAVTKRTPWKYFPSRMSQASLDHLAAVFVQAYAPAIDKRMAQLQRVNRKLARVDPGWTLQTDEQLREPAKTKWKGALV